MGEYNERNERFSESSSSSSSVLIEEVMQSLAKIAIQTSASETTLPVLIVDESATNFEESVGFAVRPGRPVPGQADANSAAEPSHEVPAGQELPDPEIDAIERSYGKDSENVKRFIEGAVHFASEIERFDGPFGQPLCKKLSAEKEKYALEELTRRFSELTESGSITHDELPHIMLLLSSNLRKVNSPYRISFPGSHNNWEVQSMPRTLTLHDHLEPEKVLLRQRVDSLSDR